MNNERLLQLVVQGDLVAGVELLQQADRTEDGELWQRVAELLGLAGLASHAQKVHACTHGGLGLKIGDRTIDGSTVPEGHPSLDKVYLEVINPVYARSRANAARELLDHVNEVSREMYRRTRIQDTYLVTHPEFARGMQRLERTRERARKAHKQHMHYQGFLDQFRVPSRQRNR